MAHECLHCHRVMPEEIVAEVLANNDNEGSAADDFFYFRRGVAPLLISRPDVPIEFVCRNCLWDNDLDIEWTTDHKPDAMRQYMRSPHGVVLANAKGNTGFTDRAYVWGSGTAPGSIKVEWLDGEEAGDGEGPYEEISEFRRVWHLTKEGEVSHLGYPFRSVEHFLQRRCGLVLSLSDFVQYVSSEGLVAPEVRQMLLQNLDQMAAADFKDYHPGSNNHVLDLIHPSLFCYVKGVSPLLSTGKPDEWVEPAPRPRYRYGPRGETDFFDRPITTSQYQWMPTPFRIDASGAATALSYISGLAPKAELPELYTGFERLLSAFVPLFEKCLTDLYRKEDEGRNPVLRDRTIQCIVKAVNYLLPPGEEHSGVWHVEGMSHERILATGIYYYDSSPHVEDQGLGFRRALTEDEEMSITEDYRHEDPPPFDWSVNAVNVGKVETAPNHLLVFPNSMQHKVLGLKNTSPAEHGHRKIVCFFLIDPEYPIVSTGDVADQRGGRLRLTAAAAIMRICDEKFGLTFPEMLLEEILRQARLGLTWEEANNIRVKLMHERKVYKDELNQDVDREISLCEH